MGLAPPWTSSGTVTSAGSAVDVRRPGDLKYATEFLVKNQSSSGILLVSFDGTAFDVQLSPGGTLSVDQVLLATVHLKAATTDISYAFVASEGDR